MSPERKNGGSGEGGAAARGRDRPSLEFDGRAGMDGMKPEDRVRHIIHNLPALVKEQVDAFTDDFVHDLQTLRDDLHVSREENLDSLDALGQVRSATTQLDVNVKKATGDLGHALSAVVVLGKGLTYYASKYEEINAKLDRLVHLVGSSRPSAGQVGP